MRDAAVGPLSSERLYSSMGVWWSIRSSGNGSRAVIAYDRDPRIRVVQELAAQIAALRTGQQAEDLGEVSVLSTGVPELDRCLPLGGVRPNSLVEWLGEPGSGAWVLGTLQAVQACPDQEWVVLVDPDGEFFPLAACSWGLDLARLLVVRPSSVSHAVWAIDESLRNGAVGAVIGCLERLSSRDSRRLQLAAEVGGRLCVLLRPARARWDPSWAEIRWYVQPVVSSQHSQRGIQVELLRCRGGLNGAKVTLELDHEAGAVRLASSVAAPAARPRSTGAGFQAAGAV